MDEKNVQQAKKVYGTLLSALEKRGWTCKKNEEELMLEVGIVGDDLPMDLRVHVNADRQLVTLYCTMPFKLSDDAIVTGALAICYINDHLPDGSFDLDISTGRICFRLTFTFRESLISEEAFYYMLDCSTYVVDEFNDKLLMIGKGMLSLEDFVKQFEG